MAEEYHTQEHNPSPHCPENRNASRDNEIRAAIETAPTVALADLSCGTAANRSGLRRIGDRWVAMCPLPDCASKVPSVVARQR
jgi:hypothetical protein